MKNYKKIEKKSFEKDEPAGQVALRRGYLGKVKNIPGRMHLCQTVCLFFNTECSCWKYHLRG